MAKEDKMDKQALIDSLKRNSKDSLKISIVQKLKAFLDELDVLRALCFESIQTDSHELRAAIIDTLRSKEDVVNPYFAHMAVNAKCTTLRKWALVNLSLMACKSARAAVVNGLHDSSGTVQHAAALNIGLYHDTEFLMEVKQFFERNHIGLYNLKDAPRKDPSSHSRRYKGSQLSP